MRRHKSAEEVDLACAAGAQEGRDSSSCGGDAAAEDVAADVAEGVASDAARFETKAVRFLEAVVKVRAETAA